MKKLITGQQAIWNNAIVLLRVWAGTIFIYHGISIFQQTSMQNFADSLLAENIPLPMLSAWLCRTSEFFGGVFLVIGFLKRPACFFLIIDMAVAAFVCRKRRAASKWPDTVYITGLLPYYSFG